MKSHRAALWGVAAFVLQIMWPQGEGLLGVVPNFFLAYMVLVSVYVDARRLVWIGFIGGFMFDMLNFQQFGFHMAFYILMALVLKLVWKLDKGNLQSASLLLATVIFTLLYSITGHVAFFAPSYIAQWRELLSVFLLETVYNCAIVVLSISVIQLRQRGIISS